MKYQLNADSLQCFQANLRKKSNTSYTMEMP